MEKLSETLGIARGALIVFLMVVAAVSSYGRTVSGRTVSVSSMARKFVPFVHKVMPLVEATEAHAILERGENRGKVILTI